MLELGRLRTLPNPEGKHEQHTALIAVRLTLAVWCHRVGSAGVLGGGAVRT